MSIRKAKTNNGKDEAKPRHTNSVLVSKIITIGGNDSFAVRHVSKERGEHLEEVRFFLENTEVTVCYLDGFDLEKFLKGMIAAKPSKIESDCYIINSMGKLWKLYVRDITTETIPPAVPTSKRIRLENKEGIYYLYPQ